MTVYFDIAFMIDLTKGIPGVVGPVVPAIGKSLTGQAIIIKLGEKENSRTVTNLATFRSSFPLSPVTKGLGAVQMVSGQFHQAGVAQNCISFYLLVKHRVRTPNVINCTFGSVGPLQNSVQQRDWPSSAP